MKNIVLFLLLLITVSCGSNDHYHDAAKDMASKIPEGSRVAIKITSPEKNGLPEVFLQKLMAEFSGALVKSSDSKFVVLSRNSTEEIWKEAIEFSNQETDKITASAEADIIIMLSPKINEGGIDLSFTAYSLREGSTGNILSSTNKFIPMNVKAELGVDVKALDKKIDELSELVDKDKAAQNNELIDLFIKFADQPDLNGMARVFSKGCDKPLSLREKWDAHFNSSDFKKHCALFSNPPINCNKPYGSEFFANFKDGFNLKCEVYNQGELVVAENIEFDKTIDIDIINGAMRGSVDSIKLSSKFPSQLDIPEELESYTKLLACDSMGYSTDGKRVYKVVIPNKKVFYITKNWSSGSAGTWTDLELSYDEESLPKRGNKDFVMAGEPFPDPPQPGWRCQ